MVASEQDNRALSRGISRSLVRPLVIIMAVLSFSIGQVFGHGASVAPVAHTLQTRAAAPGAQAIASLASGWVGGTGPVTTVHIVAPPTIHAFVSPPVTHHASHHGEGSGDGSQHHHDHASKQSQANAVYHQLARALRNAMQWFKSPHGEG